MLQDGNSALADALEQAGRSLLMSAEVVRARPTTVGASPVQTTASAAGGAARYQAFYERSLARVHEIAPGRTNSRRGSRRHFHEVSAGSPRCVWQWRFTKDRQFRMSLVIDTGDRDKNGFLIEGLASALEFSELQGLDWPDLEHAQQRRIDSYFSGEASIVDSSDDDLTSIAIWAAERFFELDRVIRPVLRRVRRDCDEQS